MTDPDTVTLTQRFACIPAVVMDPTREELISPAVDHGLIGVEAAHIPGEGPAVVIVMRAAEGVTYGAAITPKLAREFQEMLAHAIAQVAP